MFRSLCALVKILFHMVLMRLNRIQNEIQITSDSEELLSSSFRVHLMHVYSSFCFCCDKKSLCSWVLKKKSSFFPFCFSWDIKWYFSTSYFFFYYIHSRAEEIKSHWNCDCFFLEVSFWVKNYVLCWNCDMKSTYN